MSSIRTAIIGLGYWGPNVLRNFAAQPLCDIVAACDMRQELLDTTKRQYPSLHYTQDVQELLNRDDIDLILIATPTSSHFELAKACLEHNKHVFIEKPMTATSTQAAELMTLATQKNRRVFVDHTFAFAPSVSKMAELAKNGDLGTLLYYDSVRVNLGIIQKDSNVLWDLAVHDLAILSTFTDFKDIKTIAAHGSKHFGSQIEHAHLFLTYQSGFEAHIHVSWLSPVKIRQTILGGTKAMVSYTDTEPSEKLRIYDKGVDHDDTKPDPFYPKYRIGNIVIPALDTTETLSIEAAHVLAMIQSNGLSPIDGAAGQQVVNILELADAAMASGQVIPVSL